MEHTDIKLEIVMVSGWHVAIGDATHSSIADVWETDCGGDDCFEENARRLCAAWNYCEGISTEELESEGATSKFWGKDYSWLKDRNEKLQAENAALRAAVAEMERMLPVLEAVEIQHPGALSEYTPDGTLANVSAYRQTLETALAKMNEK